MARNKANQTNIDGSDLANYPNKRIRNNDGSGNGTPVNEQVYGDIHEYFAKTMREAKLNYNDLPDNVTNGYQLYEALKETPGRNDFANIVSLYSANTILLPVRVGALKDEEFFELVVNFDSPIQANLNNLVYARGTDGNTKNLQALGTWKNGDTVRVINKPNVITVVGLYDTRNLPGIAQLMTTVQNTLNSWTKIMSVFVADGAMVFWNKPANEIPQGWQEVTDWRGRFPVGLDESNINFNLLGKTGGNKSYPILRKNLPTDQIKVYFQKSTSSSWKTGGGSGTPVTNVYLNSNYSNVWEGSYESALPPLGEGIALDVLNPYRTVLFIEYVG